MSYQQKGVKASTRLVARLKVPPKKTDHIDIPRNRHERRAKKAIEESIKKNQ